MAGKDGTKEKVLMSPKIFELFTKKILLGELIPLVAGFKTKKARKMLYFGRFFVIISQ